MEFGSGRYSTKPCLCQLLIISGPREDAHLSFFSGHETLHGGGCLKNSQATALTSGTELAFDKCFSLVLQGVDWDGVLIVFLGEVCVYL